MKYISCRAKKKKKKKKKEKTAKMTKFKGPYFCPIKSNSIKAPHAYFQYVLNVYEKFEKYPLKAVDYTISIPEMH